MSAKIAASVAPLHTAAYGSALFDRYRDGRLPITRGRPGDEPVRRRSTHRRDDGACWPATPMGAALAGGWRRRATTHHSPEGGSRWWPCADACAGGSALRAEPRVFGLERMESGVSATARPHSHLPA